MADRNDVLSCQLQDANLLLRECAKAISGLLIHGQVNRPQANRRLHPLAQIGSTQVNGRVAGHAGAEAGRVFICSRQPAPSRPLRLLRCRTRPCSSIPGRSTPALGCCQSSPYRWLPDLFNGPALFDVLLVNGDYLTNPWKNAGTAAFWCRINSTLRKHNLLNSNEFLIKL